jgi:hypothetical protein
MRQPLLLCTLLVLTALLPLVPSGQAAETNDVVVCCDASPVELYLLGSDANKKLTPFASELGEDAQSISLETSISSQESLGRWVLPDTWGGVIPASTWTFAMNYEVSNAAGVQINATATINIGSKSFSASTEPGSSFLAQGTGTLSFDIDVDELTTSGSSNIELELTAQAIIFSVPGSDAKLDFLWGSEDQDSSLEATIPLLDILMVEPEVEGSDVYLAVRLDSPWGLSTLAMAESITLKVNGKAVGGDPIETASGDTVRVTWTWGEAAGGDETINVEVELVFQQGQPALSGSTTFDIETFDSGGGTGTYYPPDEPLRTDGAGSALVVTIDVELSNDGQGLLVERVTTLTINDEMAFWMRWAMDHIGDDNPSLSPMIRAFAAGPVTDEDRVSRFIEDVERSEFERQMVSLGPMYLTTGLGLDSEDLLGSFREFNELKVEVNLNGEDAVVNHPVTLRFSTTQLIPDGLYYTLIEDFAVPQPAPLWSSIDLDLSASSGSLTAFIRNIPPDSDAFDFSLLRTPWGEQLSLSAENLDQNEVFALESIPTSSLAYAPLPVTVLTLAALFGAFAVALRMSRSRSRSVIYLELVLIPVTVTVMLLGFPLMFIGIACGVAAVIWWITAMASPRLAGEPRGSKKRGPNYPTIPCPACQTMNAVTSVERPHRFACEGCQRIIKLVA